MVIKQILILIFIIITNYSYSQKDYEIFGDKLAKSIMNKDSATFKSLILPKEAILDQLKNDTTSQLNQEELKEIIENINQNYNKIVQPMFEFSFLSLTKKVKIFKLDLKNINYKLTETSETKIDTTIYAIYGEIKNELFHHFTFFAKKYKGKLYLASHIISVSEVNKFKENERLKKIKFSSDENGNMICKGKIELENKSAPKKEILNCIINSTLLSIGIIESSIDSKTELDYEYIKGKWDYTYYVNNLDDFAGIVEFKYELKIYQGIIEYKYYDFIHSKNTSKFNSIGKLPLEINDTVKRVFTTEQYNIIINDIFINQISAVKRIKKYTDKCFK